MKWLPNFILINSYIIEKPNGWWHIRWKVQNGHDVGVETGAGGHDLSNHCLKIKQIGHDIEFKPGRSPWAEVEPLKKLYKDAAVQPIPFLSKGLDSLIKDINLEMMWHGDAYGYYGQL